MLVGIMCGGLIVLVLFFLRCGLVCSIVSVILIRFGGWVLRRC